jgi:hypothetical protein
MPRVRPSNASDRQGVGAFIRRYRQRSQEGRSQRRRFRERMRHEFERAAHRGTVGGSAEADSHGFGRRPVGDESIAGNDADTGRSCVADERRAGPRFRQRQPKVEANRIGAVAMARQNRAGEFFCRAIDSWRTAARSASAVPSVIQRVASAIVTGDAITVAVRTDDANNQPERTSGATT